MPRPVRPRSTPRPAVLALAALALATFGLLAGLLPEAGARPTAPAAQAVRVPSAGFAQAAALYRTGRHAAAYGRFVRLADDGDADAARIALVMHRHDTALFGAQWDATTEELAAWTRLAQDADRDELAERLDSASGRHTTR